MKKREKKTGDQPIKASKLFKRIISILEKARVQVIRSVNSQMILAYWNIGREIVHELQGGKERAEYGKELIRDLSGKLTEKYGKGFSATNLWYFRQFYLAFMDRSPEILHKPCGEFNIDEKLDKPCGISDDMDFASENGHLIKGFSSQLSWSHYRTLAKVENKNERLFYEIEAEKEAWSVPVLERQIHSFLFARLLKSKDKDNIIDLIREGHAVETATDSIKDPYILDFLGLPDFPELHERNLEAAIIANLQSFLLELGKGFAFVGRQKRMQFDDKFFYIDLVFYNYILKCHLLIDLKIGELTHQDVGQMDSYVRMFDEKYSIEGDNPSIGLILCSRKNETIARYSVLKDNKQLFASKYMLYLPTESELQQEIQRERSLAEKMD